MYESAAMSDVQHADHDSQHNELMVVEEQLAKQEPLVIVVLKANLLEEDAGSRHKQDVAMPDEPSVQSLKASVTPLSEQQAPLYSTEQIQ